MTKAKKLTTATTTATALHRARGRASEELKLPPDDARVKRYAMLQAAYDQLQSRMAANKPIDVASLLKIDAAMAETRASAAPPLTVRVDIIDTAPDGFCGSGCGTVTKHLAPPPGADQKARDDAQVTCRSDVPGRILYEPGGP
jgi:hypothetical protein